MRGVMRRVLVGALVVMVVTACSSDESSSVEPVPSTASTPGVTEVSTTSTTIEPTTTTVAATTTSVTTTTTSTTTALPPLLEVLWGPVDGQFVGDEEISSLSGVVRPESTVTLNGLPMATGESLPQIWEYRNVSGWHLHEYSSATWGDILDEGITVAQFRAESESGDVLTVERTVHFDPRLEFTTGWLVEVLPGDPPTVTVEVARFEGGEDDDTVVVGDTYQLELGIPDDAAFILLEVPNEGTLPDTVMDREAFLDLAAIAASGCELTDYFDSCLFGVPSEFWISDSNELQQVKQIWTP